MENKKMVLEIAENWKVNTFESGEPNNDVISAMNDVVMFMEWAAYNYIRLNDFWVHKYASQTDKDFWLTTDKLYFIYKENIYDKFYNIK